MANSLISDYDEGVVCTCGEIKEELDTFTCDYCSDIVCYECAHICTSCGNEICANCFSYGVCQDCDLPFEVKEPESDHEVYIIVNGRAYPTRLNDTTSELIQLTSPYSTQKIKLNIKGLGMLTLSHRTSLPLPFGDATRFYFYFSDF